MTQDSSASGQSRLVFFGECIPGHDEAEVRRRVAHLMGLNEQQIAAVFSGQRVVLKPALPTAEGLRYAQHFASLGARTILEDVAPEPSLAPPPPVPSPVAAAPVGATMAREASAPASTPAVTAVPSAAAPMPSVAVPKAKAESAPPPVPPKSTLTPRTPPPVTPRPPMPLLAQLFGTDFGARMGRRTFLFASVITVPIALIFGFIAWRNHSVVLAFLTLIVPCFIQVRAAVMRCHDLGRNPWWLLTWLVPILGMLLWIYLLIAPGQKGANARGMPGESPGMGQVAIAGGICALVFFAVVINQMDFADDEPPAPVASLAPPPPPAPAPLTLDPTNVVVVYSMKGCEACGIRLLELRALGLLPKEVRVDESDAGSAEMLSKMAQANQPVRGLKMPVVEVNGVLLSSAPTMDEIRKVLRWVTSGTG